MKGLTIRILFLFACIIFPLCGCMMSIATTGAQAVYNRHQLQKKVTDQYIAMRALRKIFSDTNQYNESNISIAVQDSNVLLTGEVANATLRASLTQLIKTIPEVDDVHNMLTLSHPSSALTHMSDSWLTAKIKAKFISSEEIDPSQIKVVTENGIVFLMGTLAPEQAQAAVELARTTFGVQSVVKIFNYIHLSKKENIA